jgi:hypothetical protein
MAFTLGALTEIDDTAVDAESPITESLMTSLRDNPYWIVAGTTQTTESTANKVLETSGSGDMQWTDATSLNTIDGTKGAGTTGASSGAPYQIAAVTGKNLIISFSHAMTSTPYITVNGTIFIKQSDESYVISGFEAVNSGFNSIFTGSGTLTSSFVDLVSTSYPFYGRITGGNYEFYENMSGAGSISYMWL